MGRDGVDLAAVAETAGGRVTPLCLTGEEADLQSLKMLTNGGAQLAFDQVGNAADRSSTIIALRSLQRGGRLVLMGSMTSALPLNYGEVMIDNWEIIGNFMYAP